MEKQNIISFFWVLYDIFINFAVMNLKQSYYRMGLAMMMVGGLTLFSSCKDDKKNAEGDIIAPKPVVVKKKSTQKLATTHRSVRSIGWAHII